MINNRYPPSNDGIGNKFKKANQMDKVAVKVQKISQFHLDGNSLAMEKKLPICL